MKTLARHPILPVLAVFALISGAYVESYVLSGRKWPSSTVPYYVNSRSIHLSSSAAITAVQTAAANWNQQTQANIELVYAGTTSGSSLTKNGKNEVFFRNASSGGSVAETYSYWNSSNQLLDSDIVFYEGAYKFFYNSGCASGVYAENVATHEFGHMLGLRHSSASGATMASSMTGYCDRTWLTLATDDISGIQALYPSTASTQRPAAPSSLTVSLNANSPTSSLVLSWVDNSSVETGFRIERGLTSTSFSQVATVGSNVRTYTMSGLLAGTLYHFRVAAYNSAGTSSYSNLVSLATLAAAVTNTAPTVSIAAPATGASYPQGATISFTGSATDTQDGNLSGTLTWTSNLAGQIGTGASFSRTLAAGTHTITARASDSAGLSGQRQVSLTVAAASTTGVLSVTERVTEGVSYSDLRWSGLSGTSADVYRNGTRIATVPNWGNMADKSSGATFKVCTSGTSVCTNSARAGS